MIFIYGTVYNNANTIEPVFASLDLIHDEKAFYYVDNFSTDGTWEKLQSMQEKYEIAIMRRKCSRGKGRSLAMNMAKSEASENDMFMYADLDSPFSEIDIKRLTWYIENMEKSSVLFGTHLCYKDTNFSVEWRDLNSGEDWERMAHFISAGFDMINFSPDGVWGLNEQVAGYRELRYSHGISFLLRSLRNLVDIEIGSNFVTFKEYSYQFRSRIPTVLSYFLWVPYLYARISGVYTYSKDLSNVEYVQRSLRIIPPSY